MIAERTRVARAFGAACAYDEHALVQRCIADALAERIAGHPVVAARGDSLRLLEIGCGTGFLTRALLDRGLPGQWLVTDLAPTMVDRCLDATIGHGKAMLTFATMDGEAPMAGQTFDIICSSMAFQWFTDIGGALTRLGRLLSPGGALCFSTLLSGTLAEWVQAHARHGLEPGGLAYPDLERLSGLLPPGGSPTLKEVVLRQRHANAAAFLHSLKSIGAGTASRRPLPAPALRRVMSTFDAAGSTVTYRTALCCWTKDPGDIMQFHEHRRLTR